MAPIFSNIRATPSDIYMDDALDKTMVNVHLSINDMFKCFNVLLRNWELLSPAHKEIMSNFVDEFILKMIDDRVSSCKS